MKPRSFVAAASLLAFLGIASAVAQEVTISEPVWFARDPAPDEMPKTKSRLRPQYPDEMRATSELGYAIAVRRVEPDGKTTLLPIEGTHPAFVRAVEGELRDWRLTPGKRGGKPVTAVVWIAAIFNPKSAKEGTPNATPRLLSVSPATTPVRPTPKGGPTQIPVKLTLDAAGVVTAATPEITVDPKAWPAIEQTVKSWRFAPARQAGQPVAAEITLPVMCMQPVKSTEQQVPPKVVSRTPPRYPTAMRRFGFRGEVRIDFVVNEKGEVENPVIRESDNPAFDVPALKSLREWKFQPATKGGKPVKARMQVPIVFEMTGSRDMFRLDGGNPSSLPPELQYDTPPRLRNVQIPVFPHELRKERVAGKATVLLMIGTNGRVSQVKVHSADRPEFGLALAAAVETWVFDPALRDGKPVPFMMKFEQEFDPQQLYDEDADELLSVEAKHPDRIVSAAALEQPLKAVSRRSPRFPLEGLVSDQDGEALVEILIDREGYVHLPRIVQATTPAFGYAAVQAVSTWWFEAPTSKHRFRAVRVQVPLKFTLKDQKPTPAAKQ